MKCMKCEYCSYYENKSGLNRYYCIHKLNPDLVASKGGVTLICKTERHGNEMTRKRTPKWCPIQN